MQPVELRPKQELDPAAIATTRFFSSLNRYDRLWKELTPLDASFMRTTTFR